MLVAACRAASRRTSFSVTPSTSAASPSAPADRPTPSALAALGVLGPAPPVAGGCVAVAAAPEAELAGGRDGTRVLTQAAPEAELAGAAATP